MTKIGETHDMTTLGLAEIALNFPHAIEILVHYNLDFCCNGMKPFVEACDTIHLNAEQIWSEITEQEARTGRDIPMHVNTWDPCLLINFIIQHHHGEVKETIPHIKESLDNVCNVHGKDNEFLLTVRDDFEKLAEELLSHLKKEEEMLFDAIRKIFGSNIETVGRCAVHDNLDGLIATIEQEHDRTGNRIKSMRKLTNYYEPPNFACHTLRMTYLMLNQFDSDLVRLIHLENNILLPKVKR